MLDEGYLEMMVGGVDAPTYVRKDSVGALGEVDAVVFDCDGVLIDVRESYDLTVRETAQRIVGALTEIILPDGLLDGDTLFAFRRTGGFNNDWDLTYAIVMHVLSRLPEDALHRLRENAESARKTRDYRERFDLMKESTQASDFEILDLKRSLKEFAEGLDETGTLSVDRQLLRLVGEDVKEALGYPGGVGESLIPTLFEQLLSGPELFEETFRFPARFETGERGLVERGRVILAPEALTRLSVVVGSSNFGIASGSKAGTAEHVLGGLLDRFHREARVWMDDVDEAIRETGIPNLSKPHPFSLLRASRPLEPFQRLLYVGDSVADLRMTVKARGGDPRFLFAGVYYFAASRDTVQEEFMKGGADIIAPSVNELPIILEKIRGEYA